MIKERILSFGIDITLATIGGVILDSLCPNMVGALLQSLMLVLFFCRDCITGQSIGRRVVHIRVMHDGYPITPLRAFMRNVFLIIWPIELIILIVNRKRIGDIVTKSYVEKVPSTGWSINFRGVLLGLIIWALSIGLFYFLYMNNELFSMLYSFEINPN